MHHGQMKASMTNLTEETERAFTSSGMGVGACISSLLSRPAKIQERATNKAREEH